VDFDRLVLAEGRSEQDEQKRRLLQHTDSVGMVLLGNGQVKRANWPPSTESEAKGHAYDYSNIATAPTGRMVKAVKTP
jgi:hypothetical protein